MKIYRGARTIDGIEVSVDDGPLDPRTDLARYSEEGFEWSYEGPEPRQLAFAILVDHFRDANAAKRLAESFMVAVVANFDNEWEMTSDDVERALTALTPAAG